jgi:putative tryptophan/tyrosine transport system substrate-binding protein
MLPLLAKPSTMRYNRGMGATRAGRMGKRARTSEARPRLAAVMLSSSTPPGPNMTGFVTRLRALGYEPNVNIAIEEFVVRPWDENVSAATMELARQAFALILTTGTGLGLAFKTATAAVQADQPAHRRTPIVLTTDDGDCVGAGLVESLARPGGNVTGLTSAFSMLVGQRLELLREALPQVSRVAILWNASLPDKALDHRNAYHAAEQLGLGLHPLPIQHVDELPKAIMAAVEAKVEALFILGDALTFRRHKQILSLTEEHGLPVCDFVAASVPNGALMSYGPYMPALYARAADYVDWMLDGALPMDLPMEGPTQFELAINVTTAERLGLRLPDSLVRRADLVLR